MKKEIKNPILKSWNELNAHILQMDEDQCKILLEQEKQGRSRGTFLKRIHSRINKLRATRERKELVNT